MGRCPRGARICRTDIRTLIVEEAICIISCRYARPTKGSSNDVHGVARRCISPVTYQIIFISRIIFVQHYKLTTRCMQENTRNDKDQFVKGSTAPTKGTRLSEAHKKKISDAKKGMPNWRKGVIGKYHHTSEWKEKASERLIGHLVSEETKRKISKANKGERNVSWQGGKWNKSFSRSQDYAYRKFRRAVLLRDKVCVECSSENRLEVDHVQAYALFPELRLDISNARILCHSCHKKTETYGLNTKKYVEAR